MLVVGAILGRLGGLLGRSCVVWGLLCGMLDVMGWSGGLVFTMRERDMVKSFAASSPGVSWDSPGSLLGSLGWPMSQILLLAGSP